MRANMDAFGKTNPLMVEDFRPFEEAFGSDPHGKAKRKDQGQDGRFRFFSREQIRSKGDNLDIAWLRDTSNDPEDEMTEPEELAAAIARHLRGALEQIDGFSVELVTDAKTKLAREELSCIPGLVERYKQAILDAAFRGDLTAEWRANHGLAEPSIATVGALVAVPIRNGLSVRGSDVPPGIRSLRLSALRSGDVNLDDVRFLPIASSKAEKFMLCDGDVLVSRGNGTKTFVGIAALVQKLKEPTIFPDTAFRIRLASDRARPEWLTSMWNAPQVRSQIESAARTTAGIWKISQGDLARIKLSLPTPEEQEEIARRVKIAFSRIEHIAMETARATHLIDRLNQAALTKAFRGELALTD